MEATATSFTCLLLGISSIQLATTSPPVALPEDTNPFRITARQPASPGIGTAAGFSNCGGIGKVEDWRIQGCAGKMNPCVVSANTKLLGEIDFVTGDNAKEMGYQYFVHCKNDTDSADVKTPLIEKSVDTSGVEKGVPYTLHRYGLIPTKFQGKLVVAKVVLFDKSDNKTEICAQVNYQVRP